MGRQSKQKYMNPNSFDQEIKDVQEGANPESQDKGTEVETPTENPTPEAELNVDYRKKFAESSKEALRILEENKKLKAELEARGNQVETPETTDHLYPGFETLDEEAQRNLMLYTQNITKKAKEEILKDPSIAYGRQLYNKNKFDDALSKVVSKYPELNDSKEDFRTKYFNPNLVPENIESILDDVAKMYLFDKAKEIGAREEKAKLERIDLEKATGGDKTPKASRSLEDWQRMAMENPAKFAQLSKEYHADLDSGRLKE